MWRSNRATKRNMTWTDDPSLVIEMEHRFDGDVDALVSAIRNGRAFSVNGRALPVDGASRSGPIVLVPFQHRTIEIDLSSAIEKARRFGSTCLKMRFSR